MKYAIIGAMQVEIDAILAKMTVKEQKKIYDSVYYVGELYGKDVILLKCGIAPINAALCTSVAIREFGATAVINTGIAGGLDPKLNICDLVISTETGFHDTEINIIRSVYPYTNVFKADEGLVALAESSAKTLSLNYTKGLIATGNVFVNTTAQKDAIMNRLGNPLCVEMEGAAIAQTAYINEIPYLVIRSISDFSDEAANDTYEDNETKAANNSANLICEMMKNA